MTPQQLTWLNSVAAPAAVACELATKLPAALTVAQCCIESAYGTKESGANNIFGIKRDGHGNGFAEIVTHEVINGVDTVQTLEFETYASVADCFSDHARLITTLPAYSVPWKAYLDGGDLQDLIAGVARAYATSPSYAQLVSEIASEPAVVSAIAAARSAPIT